MALACNRALLLDECVDRAQHVAFAYIKRDGPDSLVAEMLARVYGFDLQQVKDEAAD